MIQLFDTQPRVTLLDRKRLEPSLIGWGKLSKALKAMPNEDIKRCVLIEIEGKKRIQIIERLVGRLHKNVRRKILTYATQNS